MKMELFWGNGISSILYDAKKEELLVYGNSQAREILHNRYGGKAYYISRSGMSGKGYIENFESLIKLGYYREKGRIEWGYLTPEVQVSVGLYNQFGRNDFLPIVFLDKKTNVIVFGDRISDWKLAQDRENAKEIEIPWYNKDLTLQRRIIFFKNPYHFRGIDIRAFLDFSFPRKEAEAAKQESIRIIHHPRLEIWKKSNSRYFYINQYGYIDIIWESEKDMLENLPNYWKTDDGKFFWRRKGLHPEVEIYYQRGSERYEKFLGDEIFNYFDSFSLIWWEKEKEKIKKEISMKVLRRIRKQFIHQGRMIQEFENQLKKHSPSLKITKRLASQYVCQEGLEAFLKEYNLPAEITLQEILNHPKWEKMVLNHHFREALLGILERKEKERIYFIERWEERRDVL